MVFSPCEPQGKEGSHQREQHQDDATGNGVMPVVRPAFLIRRQQILFRDADHGNQGIFFQGAPACKPRFSSIWKKPVLHQCSAFRCGEEVRRSKFAHRLRSRNVAHAQCPHRSIGACHSEEAGPFQTRNSPEGRKVSRLDGHEHHSIECAIGGIEPARKMDDRLPGAAAGHRLSDEQGIACRILLKDEIVAVCHIGQAALDGSTGDRVPIAIYQHRER